VRPTLGIDVAVAGERAWRELIEIANWPRWGPTVRAARLHGGGDRLYAGATGAVQTPVGLWLPFSLVSWHDAEPRRSWSWRVGGLPATTHTVISRGPSRCRVEIGVPWPATAYLGVVALALHRIRRRAEADPAHSPL
jgi:hypothetical protein